MKLDVLRINDLFAPEIGKSTGEFDLLALIKNAFIAFMTKHRGESTACWARYQFDDSKVNLRIGLIKNKPYLWGLTIEGFLRDMYNLTNVMKGSFEAHFQNLDVHDIIDPIKTDCITYKNKNVAKLDLIKLHFCGDPTKKDIIKKISTPPVKEALSNRSYFEFSIFKMLLDKAESISVSDSFYLNDDTNSDLIHDSAFLFKGEAGWIVRYQISSSTDTLISLGPCLKRMQQVLNAIDYNPTEEAVKDVLISYEHPEK